MLKQIVLGFTAAFVGGTAAYLLDQPFFYGSGATILAWAVGAEFSRGWHMGKEGAKNDDA